MRKETEKKNKLWLWIVIAVAFLALLGGIFAAFVLPGILQGDAKVIGKVNHQINSSYATLYDSATIKGTLNFANTNRYMILVADWNGTLTLTETEAARVRVQGTLAGTVTNGEYLYEQDGTGLTLSGTPVA